MVKLHVERWLKWFIFLLLIAVHSAFLTGNIRALSVTDYNFTYTLAATALIFLIAGYYAIHIETDIKIAFRQRNDAHTGELYSTANNIFIIISSIVGSSITHLAITQIKLPSILLASGIALIAGTLAQFVKDGVFKSVDFAFYAGIFVGCTTLNWGNTGHIPIAIGGFISGVLFVLSRNVLIGVGGRLGTLAFISVWVINCFFA